VGKVRCLAAGELLPCPSLPEPAVTSHCRRRPRLLCHVSHTGLRNQATSHVHTKQHTCSCRATRSSCELSQPSAFCWPLQQCSTASSYSSARLRLRRSRGGRGGSVTLRLMWKRHTRGLRHHCTMMQGVCAAVAARDSSSYAPAASAAVGRHALVSMPTPHSTGTRRKAAKNCELAGFLHQLEGHCGRCESSMHIF
jgi:hypothetical protein